MHASGQSRAYTPSTISVLFSYSFFTDLPPLSFLPFLPLRLLKYVKMHWKHARG